VWFVSQTFQSLHTQSGNVTASSDQITTVTVGTIFSTTPQIGEDGCVSLDISPVLGPAQRNGAEEATL